MKLFAGCLVVVSIAACGKAENKGTGSGSAAVAGSGSGSASGSGSGSADVGSGSGAAGSGSDAGSAGSAAAGAVVPFPKVTGDNAFIFADKPKGTVKFVVDKKPEELADGTPIEVLMWPDDLDRSENEHGEQRYVSAGGKKGVVETRHIVGDEQLAPAPKGEWALVTPSLSCGDYCHSYVWIARGLGERFRLFEHAVAPRAAWHADGKSVAVGGDGVLAILELPSGKELYKSDKFMAPAYAPDGTLYVRDAEHRVFTLAPDGTAKQVGKGKKPKLEEGEYEQPPEPVTFDDKGKFQLQDD